MASMSKKQMVDMFNEKWSFCLREKWRTADQEKLMVAIEGKIAKMFNTNYGKHSELLSSDKSFHLTIYYTQTDKLNICTLQIPK